MKYIELANHINNILAGSESLCPLYLVGGDDDYLVANALKMFESMVSNEYQEFNLVRLFSEQDIDEAIDSLDTFPMFDDYKVVILSVQNPLAKKTKDAESDEKESRLKTLIDRYLQSPSPTSVFVIECENKEVMQSMRFKNAQIVDCQRLDDASLAREIEKLANEAPRCAIDTDAIKELSIRTQNSMGRVVNEMCKLKAYAETIITKQDVCDMVASDIDYKTYELANAVSLKNADSALAILNVFFENGLRGMTIINLLYGKYRELLHVALNKDMSNDELAKHLGLNSAGAVFYLKKASANYTQMKLKKSVDYLHNLQFDVLSGKRNENSAVHEAILNLLSL